MKSAHRYRLLPAVRQSWSSRRGVTLFELIIAIALIGILGALTLPGLQGVFERSQFNNAKDDILNAMTTAHNKALANSQRSGITYTDCSTTDIYYSAYRFIVIDQSTYRIEAVKKQYSSQGTQCYSGAIQVDSSATKSYTLPTSIKLSPLSPSPTAWYATTGGQVTLVPSPFQIKLTDIKLPSDNIYYFCVDGSGLPRAQRSPCF